MRMMKMRMKMIMNSDNFTRAIFQNNCKVCLFLCLFVFSVHFLSGQTIAEKKSGMVPAGSDLTKDMQQVLKELNKELLEDHSEIKKLYAKVLVLFQKNESEESYRQLLNQINTLKNEIETLEENWRDMAIHSGNLEPYALWHQPETTLGQLIIDYGSQNYVYVMPPEISNLPVSVNSNIPIPRSSWNEMMELILTQNGIGYKQLNPYLRQLYLIKQDRSGIQLITNKRQDLEIYPGNARICFVLTPEPYEVKRAWSFLDKFINHSSTVLQMVGRDILIVAQVDEIIDLLKLYDFVSINRGDKEYKIKTVSRVDAEEMAKILAAIFDQLVESQRSMESNAGRSGSGTGGLPKSLVKISSEERRDLPSNEINGLKVIPLTHIAQAIFLVGTKEEIKKAEEIIDRVENQVGEAKEKIIYWYTCKHSDPEDLADILFKIYSLMVKTGTGRDDERGRDRRGPYPQGQGPGFPPGPNQGPGVPYGPGFANMPNQPPPPPPVQSYVQQDYQPQPFIDSINGGGFVPSKLYQNDFYQQGGYIVNPTPIEPAANIPPVANRGRDNFIVDLKTGALVMVVEAELLHKIKDLIKKLDVPKKMVQIETLVVEKKLIRNDNCGLNLLRIGQSALNKNSSSFSWNDVLASTAANPLVGVTQFIFSQKGDHGVPAFDIAYKFMIQQEDIQINANPTVIAVNQTPAKIAIVDEISINTGIFLVPNSSQLTQEQSFTRAQYGITIIVTPTIHYLDESDHYDENVNYVTMDTDITFDTVSSSGNSQQPTVTRRHIANQVSVPDGQTVVIGGLRRKNTDDLVNSIPFLGEIPGFGKLFSTTTMADNTTELYIFLTPKIIVDPTEDFDRLKREEMTKRPGDIPEFMCRLARAQEMEKQRLFAGTMNLLFGRPPDRCVVEKPWSPFRNFDETCPSGGFDGR
jgi:general secretion pathway protein D